MNLSISHHKTVLLLLTFCTVLGLVQKGAFCRRLIPKHADMLFTSCTSDSLRLVHLDCTLVNANLFQMWCTAGLRSTAVSSACKLDTTVHTRPFLTDSGPNIMHERYLLKPKLPVHDHNHWCMLDADQASIQAALPRTDIL